MSNPFISVGRFFFRHRNWSFPILTAALFAIAIPPSQTFGSETVEHVKDGVAVLIAMAGLALRGLVIGYQYVRRTGENRTIHAATLFTDGVFAICRNPLYTGNILIVFGIFLMHGSPVVLTLGTAAFVFIYAAMVAAEENYLLGVFGLPYATYRERVPRWVPDLRRLAAATQGLRFNPRRVLLVEYTNIGVTVLALTSAEMYEELAEPVSRTSSGEVPVLVGILAVAALWMAGVRVLKKRRIIVA